MKNILNLNLNLKTVEAKQIIMNCCAFKEMEDWGIVINRFGVL